MEERLYKMQVSAMDRRNGAGSMSELRTQHQKLAMRKAARKQGPTHDCAFLEPLALPPDLPPPVILMVWLVWLKSLVFVEAVRLGSRVVSVDVKSRS